MIVMGGSAVTVAFRRMAGPRNTLLSAGDDLCGGSASSRCTRRFRPWRLKLTPTARATGVAIFAFSLFLGGSIGSFVVAQGV